MHDQSSTDTRARRLPQLAPAALALLLGGCAGGTAPAPRPASPAPTPAPVATAPALPSDTLREPFTVRSGPDGVLDVTLAATWALLPVPGHAQPLPLRTYRLLAANGVSYADSGVVGFPGPTFRVSPGDSVALLLLNQLVRENDSGSSQGGSNEACVSYPAADSIDAMPDCFHGSEWTNIHYHGFHVTPDSLGDDVLLQIAPGDTFRYAFRIPHNQSPGTHWYHPHKHGSVALQVMNGMSGAFVVEGGGLDELTRRHGIRERLLALQQIDTTVNLLRPAGSPTSVPPTLVNGQLTPLVVMQPGEVQRWRIVNENVTKSNQFRVSFADSAGEEPRLYDIARDGVQYAPANYSRPGGRPAPDTSVLVAPGNRLDVFVQAPANRGVFGVHAVSLGHLNPLDQTRKAPRTGGGGGGGGGGRRLAAAAAPQPLFYVQVADGPESPTTLPDALPPLPGFLANLPGPMDPDSIDAARMPVVVFADSAFGAQTQTDPTRFFIGTVPEPYRKFGPQVYVPESAGGAPLPMRLDSVQTWKVVNQSLATNHPFHIHINPFQVIHVEYPQGAADPNAPLYAELNAAAAANRAPVWMDVVALPLPDATDPVGKPGYVIIRQRYADFTGQYVMHCHILGHEERGMMQLVEVRDGAATAAPLRVRKDAGAHRH